jgi:hypothetical protein
MGSGIPKTLPETQTTERDRKNKTELETILSQLTSLLNKRKPFKGKMQSPVRLKNEERCDCLVFYF